MLFTTRSIVPGIERSAAVRLWHLTDLITVTYHVLHIVCYTVVSRIEKRCIVRLPPIAPQHLETPILSAMYSVLLQPLLYPTPRHALVPHMTFFFLSLVLYVKYNT